MVLQGVQMFKIVNDSTLQKMLPPTLKDLSRDELKTECLLESILAVLEGKEMDFSSESSDEQSLEDSTKKKSKSKKRRRTVEIDNSTVLPGEENHVEDVDSQDNDSTKKKLKGKKRRKTVEIDNSTVLPGEVNHVEKPKDDNEHILLEILGLEIRAQAIRLLLMDESPVKKDSFEKVDTISSSIHVEEEIARKIAEFDEDSDVEEQPAEFDEDSDVEEQPVEHQSNIIDSNECGNDSDSATLNECEANVMKQTESQTTVDVCTEVITNNSTDSTDLPDQPYSSLTRPYCASRWLAFENLARKVVLNGKMCTNIRKRMKNSRISKLANDVQEDSNKRDYN